MVMATAMEMAMAMAMAMAMGDGPDAGPRPDSGPSGNALVLKHNSSDTITPNNSYSCADNGGHHRLSSFMQEFDLGSAAPGRGMTIEKVEVGIDVANDANGAGQPVTVYLFTATTNEGLNGAPPLAVAAGVVTDTTNGKASIPIAATIPAGNHIRVDFELPDGHDNSQAGHQLVVGSNNAQAGGVTYSWAPGNDCRGNDNYVIVPGMSLVLSVHGQKN